MKAPSPMTTEYYAEREREREREVSLELNATDAAYYQSLIRVVRWIVELGQVDICTEVLMLSSCLALPREGYLQQLFHMFSYLEKQHNCLIFQKKIGTIQYILMREVS